MNPEQVEVEIWRADELEVRRGRSSELDDMWGFCASESASALALARHGSPHRAGAGVGVRTTQRRRLLQAPTALEPFGITQFYTDGWGAYERHIDAKKHHVGKENTQKIESKHINLRTRMKRLVRRTLCFSKTEQMHDLVIG